MMGYDRPLRPEWIYETLRNIQPNTPPEAFYETYNNIAVELTGKDGRRKTRTILFRTFIYSFQEKTTIIEDNFLMELCRQKDFDYMKPMLLSKFMMDYDILRYFTQQFHQIFDLSHDISSTALTLKMTERFGDTEIIKRSTRAFIKTLCYFGILLPSTSVIYHQLPQINLSPEQVRDILKLYAIVNNTKQIDLLHLDTVFFTYYSTLVLSDVASQYHPTEWEYIHGINRELLMMA